MGKGDAADGVWPLQEGGDRTRRVQDVSTLPRSCLLREAVSEASVEGSQEDLLEVEIKGDLATAESSLPENQNDDLPVSALGTIWSTSYSEEISIPTS